MKAALRRAGNAFSKLMGHSCWLAYDFRRRSSGANSSGLRKQTRSAQVYVCAREIPASPQCEEAGIYKGYCALVCVYHDTAYDLTYVM